MRIDQSAAIRRIRRLYVASGLQAALPHRLKTAVRRAWLPVARAIGYPVSSPRLPRPTLPADRTPMRLGRVVMACDLNPEYLDYWPSARRAWLDIVGVEPLLLLIADDEDVPETLRSDEFVVSFSPIEGVHPALQAQCVRLHYPAVVDADEDAVLISDIDLYPLRPSYFLDPIRLLDSRYFVTYRDIYLDRSMVSMLFNAATPQTWSDLFDVSTLENVRAQPTAWTSSIEYV